MKYVGLTVLVGVLALAGAPPLFKAKEYRELTVFLIILILALTLALLYALRAPLPSISEILQRMAGPMSRQ